MKEIMEKIDFEGEITEQGIATLVNRVDGLANLNRSVQSNLKVAIIELGTNVITHHSGTPYCRLLVDAGEDSCTLEISNFANRYDLEVVEQIIDGLHKKQDIGEHYFEQYGSKSDGGHSAKLGLIRVFKLSSGSLELKKEFAASKIRITFTLTIHDNN